MTTANLNLVHETEAQRRHARVKIPARLIVTDHQHNQYVLEINEISASGFSVVDEESRLHLKHIYKGRLLFIFDSVEFVLKVNFQVINELMEEHRFGCEFQDLGIQEVSTLRLLISKFLGGEIARVNDVLTTMNRENFTKARKVNTSAGLTGWARVKALLVTLVVFTIGLGAFISLLTTLATHFLMTNARSASVVLPQLSVLMPREGNVDLLVKIGSQVKAGTPVARIQAPWTEQLTTMLKSSASSDPELLSLLQTQMNYPLTSPCDCEVVGVGVMADGQFLARDKAVVQLVPAQSKPYVQANFDYADYAGLTAGSKVSLTLPGLSPELSGTVSQVVMNDQMPNQTQGVVSVVVIPDKPLPAAAVGSPVAVSIAPSWLGQLYQTAQELLTRIIPTP